MLKLERIQRIATKMEPDLEDLTYEERLRDTSNNSKRKKKETERDASSSELEDETK